MKFRRLFYLLKKSALAAIYLSALKTAQKSLAAHNQLVDQIEDSPPLDKPLDPQTARQPVVIEQRRLEEMERRLAERTRELEQTARKLEAEIAERQRIECELQQQRDFAMQVMNALGQGVTVTDANSRFEFVNPAYARALGYDEPAFLLGKRPVDFTAPEDYEVLAQARSQRYTGQTTTYELRMQRLDGTVVPVLVTGVPRWQDGKVIGTIAVTTDLTQVKQAEQLIRESKAYLQAVIENLPFDLWVRDIDGRYTIQNPKSLERWGNQLGTRLDELDLPEDILAVWRENNHRAFAGEVVSGEEEYVFSGGKRVYHNIVAPIRDGEQILGIVGVNIDITGRKQMEESLRKEQIRLEQERQRLHTVLEIIPSGLWVVDTEGQVLAESAVSREIWVDDARPNDEPPQYKGWWADTGAPLAPEDWSLARTLTTGAEVVNEEIIIEAFDGTIKTILNSTIPIKDESGAILGAVVLNMDITERKNLEEQLRQSQKMEAIGRLAGGIAHDFNNILTVIIGHSELILSGLSQEDRLYQDIDLIRKAGERAAALTHQLLAFSRQQLLQPKTLNLNQVVAEMEQLLQRLIGEDIELTTVLAPELGQIKADPSQIEQVILNIAVNARDAMPQGGRLVLETANKYFDEISAQQHPQIEAGHYSVLSISDTGNGMDANIKARLFEPFFTTKGPGQGTGLGLAMVHGIISQSGGHISVHSEPGQGATFKIYLPQAE